MGCLILFSSGNWQDSVPVPRSMDYIFSATDPYSHFTSLPAKIQKAKKEISKVAILAVNPRKGSLSGSSKDDVNVWASLSFFRQYLYSMTFG